MINLKIDTLQKVMKENFGAWKIRGSSGSPELWCLRFYEHYKNVFDENQCSKVRKPWFTVLALFQKVNTVPDVNQDIKVNYSENGIWRSPF